MIMKTHSNSSRAIEILSALFFALTLFASTPEAAAASAAPPDLMTYQGYLVDVNGAALAQGAPANYPVVFRIYDASTGGNILWSEQQIVTVDKGNFSVVLGEGTAVSGEARPALSSAFVGTTASDRYIGITVTINGTTMTISPRLRLLTSPYAFAASKAMSIDAQASSRLSENRLYLGSGTDLNNGLGYSATFGGATIGGPALFGASGGVLGTVANGNSETGTLFWNSSGNVGIGTASPNAKLDVSGNVTVSGNVGIGTASPQTLLDISHNGSSAFGVGIHIKTPSNNDGARLEFERTGVKAWGIGIKEGANNSTFGVFEDNHYSSGWGTARLAITAGGNVGIGTATPLGALDVNGSSAANSWAYIHGNVGGANPSSASTAGLAFGWNKSGGDGDSHILYGSGVGGAPRLVLGSWNGSSVGPVLTLRGGYVGIGTESPRCPLEVSTSAGFNLGGYGYLGRGGTGVFNENQNDAYSIYAQQRIAAAEFNAYSDRRIKDVIGASDTGKDLATIQKLSVTDYRMVDKVAEGSAARKGFIAQEVEKIIPEAVTQRTDFVPDIYATATAVQFNGANKSLTVTLPKAHGLKVGDRVRIVADDAKLDLKVTAIPAATQFVAGNCEKAAKQVFVLGKEVADFRILNYDRIFTTGIGAIQELAHQVEQLKKSEARIAELEKSAARVAALEAKAARVDTLEREVAELRKVVSSLASASKDSPKSVAISSPAAGLVTAEVR
jgi:hypothetical protein